MNIRLGPWSQLLAPSYSFCRRCRTPWRFVIPHDMWYTGLADVHPSSTLEQLVVGGCRRGVLALCERCWAELPPERRLPYYRQVWEIRVRSGEDPRRAEGLTLDEQWRAIKAAVLAGG